LSVQVSSWRKVLGETAFTTVAGCGYKWATTVDAREGKEAPADTAEISRKQGVQSLLQVTVRRADRRPRIGVELIDRTVDEATLARHHDRHCAEWFEVQDEISAKIAGTSIEPACLKREERRAWAGTQRGLMPKSWYIPTDDNPAASLPSAGSRAERIASFSGIRRRSRTGAGRKRRRSSGSMNVGAQAA